MIGCIIAVAIHISHINSGNNMVMIFCIDISDKLVNFGGYTSNTSWKPSIIASCTNMQMIQSKRGFWLFSPRLMLLKINFEIILFSYFILASIINFCLQRKWKIHLDNLNANRLLAPAIILSPCAHLWLCWCWFVQPMRWLKSSTFSFVQFMKCGL